MRKGEQTRHMIISKSSPLFNQKGYASTFISDVMEETGLKKGGIYRHFESKDELSVEAFQFSVKTISAHYKRALEGKKSAQERLLAFIDAFQALANDIPIPGGCPLMNAAIESDDTSSVLAPHVRSAMAKLLSFVERLVAEGQEKGEISKEVNGKQAAIVIVSTLEGALAISRLYQDVDPIENATAHLRDYVRAISI